MSPGGKIPFCVLFIVSVWPFDFFLVCGTQQLDVYQKPPGQTYGQSAEHPEVHRLQWDLFDASNGFYVVQVGNVFNYTSNRILFSALSRLMMNNVAIISLFYFFIFFDSGQGSLLLPFIYYRFLTLRYTSRRNPYCRWVVQHDGTVAKIFPLVISITHQNCAKLQRKVYEDWKILLFFSL